MNIDDVGLTTHLCGTLWYDKQSDKLFVLPLFEDIDIAAYHLQIEHLDDSSLIKLLNRSWNIETRRYEKTRSRVIKNVLHKIQNRVDQNLTWTVFRRDSYTCVYCGDWQCPLTFDHFVPKSQGGATTLENGRTCCKKCNKLKADMSPEEWMASKELLKQREWIKKVYAKTNTGKPKSRKS